MPELRDSQATYMGIVPATLKARLQLKSLPHKKVLIFVFYSIFKLKFDQKRAFLLIPAVISGARTVYGS